MEPVFLAGACVIGWLFLTVLVVSIFVPSGRFSQAERDRGVSDA